MTDHDDIPGAAEPSDPAIELRSVRKLFGDVVAVDDVELVIRKGEFFSLLGPSGCGKTTTLRMLAGFEFPDAGTILLEGRDVSNVPANKRPVNMVFQRYELFPHMTVAQNVGYGLRMHKVPKAEIRERVSAMLDIVGVAGLERRRADQLSGGQQQRVALARALVNRPRVLLLDEPLSALDVKLRKHMQLELKSIQHELGTTFVYVTHDQEEALLMSDRIGVMADGRLLQVGSPREMYERPAHPFVADFVGTLNELAVTVDAVDEDGRAVARFGDAGSLVLPAAFEGSAGQSVRVGVRPERVELAEEADAPGSPGSPGPAAGARLAGVISDVVYLGALLQYVVDTGAGQLVAQVSSITEDTQRRAGDTVLVTWPDSATLVLETTDPSPPADPVPGPGPETEPEVVEAETDGPGTVDAEVPVTADSEVEAEVLATANSEVDTDPVPEGSATPNGGVEATAPKESGDRVATNGVDTVDGVVGAREGEDG